MNRRADFEYIGGDFGGFCEEVFARTAAGTCPITGKAVPRNTLLIFVVNVTTDRAFVPGHHFHPRIAGILNWRYSTIGEGLTTVTPGYA